MLDEHGDAIEADLLRFYQVDLLDFYRGTLSARRLGVLLRELPAKSSLVYAIHGGKPPLSRLEHFMADVWAQLEAIRNPKRQSVDHPVRAEMEEKARASAKSARVLRMNEKRKRTYGLE